ncbi:hypothetical protein [Clostridium transplantifaecale]|uniref:hypothetical protein n=1 Tax=Clostridium transplantifaecale TaxID=2479838 RepID=UPI000F63D04F|nr:hypothetical protein [Clostridium transplantifaecale]
MGIIGSFQGWVDSPLPIWDKGWKNISPTGWDKVYSNHANPYIYTSGSTLHVNNAAASTSDYIIIARTTGKVNLSSYSYISIGCGIYDDIYDNGKYAYVGVSTAANLTSASFAASVSVGYKTKQYAVRSIDVKSLSGEYYIYFLMPSMKRTSDDDPYLGIDSITLVK